MKIFYFIVALAVLYFAFGYIRFKYILSHANLDAITHSDEILGSGVPLRYLAAGDSTAYGEGASKVENTYAYRVAEYFSHTSEVHYRNIAVVGTKTEDLIENQLNAISEYDPDIVTISIGANDVTHFVSAQATIENYKKIIQELAENTKAQIYITNVPRFDYSYLLPFIFREYFDAKAKSINKALLDLGTDRVHFVDIHEVAVDNARDQFHPSDTGYTFWTESFLREISATIST